MPPTQHCEISILDWKNGKLVTVPTKTEPVMFYGGHGDSNGPVKWEPHQRGQSIVYFPSRLVPKCSASFDWEPEEWGAKENIVYVSPLLAVKVKHFLKDHL